MKVHYGLENVNITKSTVVTTGTFDGVHLGHKKILTSLVQSAKSRNLESVVLTFWPHPRNVIKHGDPLFLLSSLDEKIKQLELYDVDHVVVIEFTLEFSKLSSQIFLKTIIEDKLKTRLLIIGYDHHFGRNREGSFDYIVKHQNEYSFDIQEIQRKDIESLAVSSTEIRNTLSNGDVDKASKLLGYNYTINGLVVKGNQIGRKLGFPTANIDLGFDTKLIPKDGSYIVKLTLESGESYFGMLNIGVRPTVNTLNKTIEVNIFNFDRDIYNENIEVKFLSKIRNEKKFNNLNELSNQLGQDKIFALKYIQNEKI